MPSALPSVTLAPSVVLTEFRNNCSENIKVRASLRGVCGVIITPVRFSSAVTELTVKDGPGRRATSSGLQAGEVAAWSSYHKYSQDTDVHCNTLTSFKLDSATVC